MNRFDLSIIVFFNKLANHSRTFDALVEYISNAEIFKGGVLMALLWWVWFRGGKQQRSDREAVLATLAAGVTALFAARTLALTLPFRLRPVLALDPTRQGETGFFREWSSFPSDHATLFFALATGLLTISRRMGVGALFYVATIICLPRIYLGHHYPTDLIAGGCLGATFGYAANRARIRPALAGLPMRWMERHPSSFYACLFLATYLIATLFQDIRHLGNILFDALDHWAQS